MFTARFHASMDAIDGGTWDALAGAGNPFVSHAFLAGLERHDCIRAEWGWQAHHLAVHEDDRLVAAAPVYLKGNSHGEYVFDWGWAHAWERAGQQYYPKLLVGVPYSPIPGPRLLARAGPRAGEYRRILLRALVEETRRLGLSSVHVNFLPECELEAFDDAWLERRDIQFHWHNRGYADFGDFLAALKHKKRKNIRQERRQVEQAGVTCGMQAAATLEPSELDQVHALYLSTFDEKGNHAALTRAFFHYLAGRLGGDMQVALARREGDIVAMALFLQGGDTLYGRYWGACEDVPGLHFELCYYRGIEHAIARGLERFEPGAQGRHKMARGFLPTLTHSRHYLDHPGFRTAVAEALAGEADDIEAYHRESMLHSPYADR